MAETNKSIRKFTPEEVKELEQMGFKVIYKSKCILCGKKFSSKNEEHLAKRFKKHVDEKCPAAKWARGATKILEIAGLKNVMMSDLYYLQEGEFFKGYERTNPEEIEILDNVKNMFDNWGKE